MPDLASHVAAAWVLGRSAGLVRPIRPRAVYLFALGSALPDLLARAPHLVLDSAALKQATVPLHTPAALLVAALLGSFLFEERGRGAVFAALSGGAMFHCALDALQEIPRSSPYLWLYPLSDLSPQLALFSGETTVLWLPWLLGLGLLLEWAQRFRRPRR